MNQLITTDKKVITAYSIKNYLATHSIQTNGRTLTQVDCSKNYLKSKVYIEGKELTDDELRLVLLTVVASPRALRIIDIFAKGGFSSSQKYALFKLVDESNIFKETK
jgi:hypothetical protein